MWPILPITKGPLVMEVPTFLYSKGAIQHQDSHHLPLVYLSQTREGG